MRTALVISMLLLLAPLSEAGPVYETFRSGILGIPWGATLDHVIGVYPDGDNVFATTPGHRAYFVKDGATFLGVPRERQGVVYGFDAEDKLGIVAIAFAYERKEELRGALISLFGPPRYSADPHDARVRRYLWTSDEGMRAQIEELGAAQKTIVWLVVAAPNYKYVSAESSTRGH
jgi:hypothetical protein